MEQDRTNTIRMIRDAVDSVVDGNPHIERIVICGSSRFCDIIAVIQWEFEKHGVHAMGPHLLPAWYTETEGWKIAHHGAEQEDVTDALNNLHIEKIKYSDAVFVCNWEGYIGEQTDVDIRFAQSLSMATFYLV